MSIRVTTLGAVQVVRGDTVLSALPSQRLRCALLIYMAVHRQAPRERLLGMFWPEKTDDRARHALSQNIYELRRVLGDDWLEVRGEQLIAASHISIDLHAFEQSVERGDYSMALSMYRGPFLDGFFVSNAQAFDTWVESVRQRVQRHHRRARREGIRTLIDGARLKEALASARDWVSFDATDDEAQHRLIELLADTGDRAGAIRQYDLYQKTLASEELQPLDETKALVDRIRGGDVGPLPLPSAVQPARASQREVVSSAEPLVAQRPEPPPPASVMPPAQSSRPLRRRSFVSAWIAIIAVVVIGSATAVYRLSSGPAATLQERAAVAVAVLPLEDHTAPPGAAYLANGLTQELIAAFSGHDPVMTVRSKQQVGYYASLQLPFDSLARVLVADVLIAGNMIRADGRVRVNVELVDGKTGVVLEPVQAERADGELFQLVDELVEKLELALRRRIGVEIARAQRRVGAPSVEALQLLGEADDMVRSGVRFANAEPAAARRELARADSILQRLERQSNGWLEPTLQRATLAEIRAVVERQYQNVDGARAWLDTAIAHVDRAVARSKESSLMLEARGTALFRFAQLGQINRIDADSLMRRAERDLNRASMNDPMRAQAHALLATIRYSMGLFAEANAAALRAQRLDPFYRQASENIYNIAITDFELHEDARADAKCREGFQRFGDWRFAYCRLYVMAFSDGKIAADPDSAWAILQTARAHRRMASNGIDNTPLLEMLIAGVILRAGRADSAAAVLKRAAARPPTEASPWVQAAVWYRLGDAQQAADILLEHGKRDHTLGPAVTQNRALRPVIEDARVARLVRPRG